MRKNDLRHTENSAHWYREVVRILCLYILKEEWYERNLWILWLAKTMALNFLLKSKWIKQINDEI